jgi:hypothetical protein
MSNSPFLQIWGKWPLLSQNTYMVTGRIDFSVLAVNKIHSLVQSAIRITTSTKSTFDLKECRMNEHL